MPRDPEPARLRLQEAALALYREHGFEHTTSADIAARAGVTERTFFRHFADKREVMFAGEAGLTAAIRAGVEQAPADAGPLAVLWSAFRSVEPRMTGNRAFVTARHEVISASPALAERETRKLAAMAATLADALIARGVPPRRARLAADVGVAAFARASYEWIAAPRRGFTVVLNEVFTDLAELVGGPPSA